MKFMGPVGPDGTPTGATIEGVTPNTIVVGLKTGEPVFNSGPCRLERTEASNAGYQFADEAASVGKSRI